MLALWCTPAHGRNGALTRALDALLAAGYTVTVSRNEFGCTFVEVTPPKGPKHEDEGFCSLEELLDSIHERIINEGARK